MIARFSDQAAHERTFVAWVRTAIAVMAFGFVVEKFDLFLAVAIRTLEERPALPGHEAVGDVAGLLLILLSGAMMAAATAGFRPTWRDIDARDQRLAGGGRLDVAMVGTLLALGATLFAYLLYTVLSRLA